jgi:hypothetical protein
MKNYVQITIRSKKATDKTEYGRQFLLAMINTDPRLEPEFIDCVLTRRNTTPYDNLEYALTRWATRKTGQAYTAKVDGVWGAKWKRKSRPSYGCRISHMLIDNYGDISPSNFNFSAKYDESVNWPELFRLWCTVSDAQIAILHHFTEPELINKYRDFEIGNLGILWKPSFPEIAWAMMFGDDFVHAVDVEKLTALGFPVEAVGSGYLVRVTESLLDVSQRFDYFCERRELLRANLPRDIFTDPDEAEANRAEIERLIKERDANAASA